MVICLERGADLHMAQLLPLPLSVSCFSIIQIGFTFLVPAYLDGPVPKAVKWVCVVAVDGACCDFVSIALRLVRPRLARGVTSHRQPRQCRGGGRGPKRQRGPKVTRITRMYQGCY